MDPAASRRIGDSEVIQLRIVRISPGKFKSASLQRLIAHCWGVNRQSDWADHIYLCPTPPRVLAMRPSWRAELDAERPRDVSSSAKRGWAMEWEMSDRIVLGFEGRCSLWGKRDETSSIPCGRRSDGGIRSSAPRD